MPAIDLEWRAEHFASRSKMTNSSGNFWRTEGDVVYSVLSLSVKTVKYFYSPEMFSLGKTTYYKKGKQLMYGTKNQCFKALEGCQLEYLVLRKSE